MELDKILENVQSWAIEIGRMQIEKLDENIKFSTKSTKIDMVTEVDILSEKMIIEKIRTHYPDHSILSEEAGLTGESDEYVWIIDPIDGTTNYLHGFPIFCISIALKHRGETVLGVIYVPKLDEMFYAIKGQGAFLNDSKIYVSEMKSPNGAFLTTGFPYDRAASEDNNLNLFNRIVKEVQAVRGSGSAAFDCCSVSCGRSDGYWEIKLSIWDIAAGELIVREAGGTVILTEIPKLNGETGVNIIAAPPHIAEYLHKTIGEEGNYFI